MSGHSKWANIKRQKQAKDLVRGNIFSKLSRLITLAVIEGSGIIDPEHNVKLRLAIEKAKQLNMPKINIDRAVERGVGPGKDTLKELILEAFAPAGVALVILVTTDNINRTVSEVRNILEKYEGKLTNQGSADYLFQKCGLVIFNKGSTSEEEVFAFAQKTSALDIDSDKNHFFVFLPFENLGKIKDHLGRLKYEAAEIDYKPKAVIKVEDKTMAKKILSLVEILESLDDVQKVFANFDIPDEYLK